MMRSLSYHINHLFMELGKAMLLTSRRENSPVNLSPSVISVANNIASIMLEHLNFEGHSVSSEREMTVTTKCQYLGKVAEFIDGILLDRPESCNPIMVNSFYCCGVIQAILTTFQATSELLFTMSRPPSSPMETDSKTGKDGKDMNSSWIYGPLISYGAIMDHLVTSSFILSSSTRQLLEQPIFNGSVRFPQDAERFMKLLQSKVLKTVLPIWAHPEFPECNIELISSVMSIMRHVCSGVEVKNTVGNDGARLTGPPPDESAISLIVEMGFSRARAEEALRQVGTNSVEIATDWLFSHPEDELARALAMSLGNSEVLSSRQNQVTQTSNDQPQNDGDIDPEFLAALPLDIREEVLAQQRSQRIQQQSQELEGQPVEMDAVSIIATFPSEIREEVLLTSPDTLLATLTPALVAEANMLRERFAHRYHSSSLFGMNSRNRRGESSRRDIMAAGLDRNTGDPSRSTSKPIEIEGAPLVDEDGLKALIRLLRVVQPLYKGQLQRLLVNLCTHRDNRQALVQILVDMLMLDLQGFSKKSVDASEPPFRLYGCHANITYSRPQSSNGVPPLVSRRVLETLTNLARSHPNVAKLLLFLEFPCPSRCRSEAHDHRHGKAVLEDGEERKAFAVVLLLTLLNQPLYMRSVAHLEQLLNLLEVVMHNAENEINQAKLEASSEKPSENAVKDVKDNTSISDSYGSKSNPEDGSKALAVDNKSNLRAVLRSLPQSELRLLCSLLAHDGLSDSAYLLVGEVLKKIVALAPFFCCHFINELARSMQSLTFCAMKELRLYENSEKALLSSTSANGTAILRVVQALSSLVSTLQDRKDPEQPAEKDHSDAVSQISEINTALDALWLELSNCISKIESSSEYASNLTPASASAATLTAGVAPPLPAGTQNILPYIESFFVTCEKLRPGQPDAVQEASTSDMEDASTSSGGQRSYSCQASLDEKQNAFVKFSEKHRRLLNAFIHQNPGLLEKSFSLMLKIPRLIDFDNKRAYFRSKIKHQYDHHHHNPVRISVRRSYILEDSYNQLRMRSPQDLKGRLTVHFQGEEGIDAGGLTREWYQSLSRVIFDKSALLFTTVGNDLTFQPNPNSVYQTEHLSYFKFAGRVVGKALFDGQLLDAHFTRSFYKHILGVRVTYHDIEAIDPAYYKNLKWMLENDISDVLDLTFSMDADEEKLILYEKAEVTDCELIPGGRNIRVTEENKHQYVDRVAEHRLTTAIRPQINAFLEGFNELIPRELISIFNDKELELLISGLPDIDLDDLKANTEYSGYSIASPVIQWFWEIVQGFSKEDKARFLQFVTGTSKVPLEGFSALQGISGPQRFQIHKAYGSTNHLPSAHTCFNQLDLPEYTSKEQLQERLLLAIHEANEGFGFG
ncbi:E3 ubiquitin-protein ligase UPL1 [Zea mays]|uniref:HECT-type E3 ubiquitin transferase n=1 Tax=Zea mays TaxID=4577 RepID=A0A1D6MU71_MAIZE|nr:E3 ubiquitin-protein ligase UPL1 [Zea mays]